MPSEQQKDTSGFGSSVRGLGFHYPVSAMRVFGEGTIELMRKGEGAGGLGGPRGQIRYLSARARSKMLFTLSITKIGFTSLLTLTYPRIYPTTGTRVKEDLNRFRVNFKRRFGGDVFWFLEFQERGAPHFHVFSTWDCPSQNDRVDLAIMWVDAQKLLPGKTVSDIVSRETIDLRRMSYEVTKHPKTWESIRFPRACVHYAAKYALKPTQKVVPVNYQDVGRFWGCSRGVRDNTIECTEYPIDDYTVSNILRMEKHPVSGWDNYPKYLFGVQSVS